MEIFSLLELGQKFSKGLQFMLISRSFLGFLARFRSYKTNLFSDSYIYTEEGISQPVLLLPFLGFNPSSTLG